MLVGGSFLMFFLFCYFFILGTILWLEGEESTKVSVFFKYSMCIVFLKILLYLFMGVLSVGGLFSFEFFLILGTGMLISFFLLIVSFSWESNLVLCDSSSVGLLYFLFSFFGGVLGFSFSFYMSMELGVPFSVLQEDFYFLCVTAHGLVMLFFFLTTFASGFSNFFIPGLCFLEDMYLQKGNVFGLYLVVISFLFLVFSCVFGEGVGTGWTVYVPLSLLEYSPTFSLELAIVSVHLFSASSTMSSMNILLTVLLFSSSSVESVFDFSPFVVSYFLTSCLVVLAVPALTTSLTMLAFDSNFSTFFFGFEFGGDPILFQTIFWMFAHPEVYILILPVFGVVSLVTEGLCGGGFYNKMGIVFSMASLFVLSFIVFGHHMVSVGYGLDFSAFFMTTTIIISVPTGVKIFSWMYGFFLFGNSFSITIGFLGMFLFFFSFGGVSGVVLSNVSLDLLFHDTYFVVGHFHTILSVAAICGFFSGLSYFFWGMVGGFSLKGEGESEGGGSIFFLFCFFMNFIFFSFLFLFSFHVLGWSGLASSVSSYSFEFFFLMQMISLGVIGFYFLMCLFIIFFILFFLIG